MCRLINQVRKNPNLLAELKTDEASKDILRSKIKSVISKMIEEDEFIRSASEVVKVAKELLGIKVKV